MHHNKDKKSQVKPALSVAITALLSDEATHRLELVWQDTRPHFTSQLGTR